MALAIELERLRRAPTPRLRVTSPGWRLPRISAALPLPLALLNIFGLSFVPKTDPDYWWHVRTGQYIAETGTLPRGDIFSYTMREQPWVTHEWLTELLFYLLQQQLGYVGLAALFGALGIATWLAVYATCRTWGVGPFGAALLSLWGFAMMVKSLNVRPQMLTVLLLAATILIVTRYKHGHARALWLLPPMFALWVNLHGGYVIGLVVLGLAVVGEGAALLRRQTAAPLRPLVAATVVSAAATLLNPHGVEALLYPFSYAGSGNASMRYILEWQSPNFHDGHFLVLVGGSLLAAILLGVGRRPLGATEALWALLFGLMALQSLRHVPLFAVVLVPLLGARLRAELPSRFQALLARWRPSLAVLYSGVAVFCVAALAGAALDGSRGLQLGREPSAESYPSGAIEYLRAHNPSGNLFHEYGWGGYLIYQLYPERRVFIDGRADVYGDAFMDRYMAVHRLRPEWQQVLEEHDVQLVLAQWSAPVAVALSVHPEWETLYAGEVERLFVRRPRAGA